MDETGSEALLRHWKHSHEEDTPAQRVFRPADYHFPPSRGRFSFELNPDGTAVFRDGGACDKPGQTLGSWSLNNSRLTLRYAQYPEQDQVLEIESVDSDRLVIRK